MTKMKRIFALLMTVCMLFGSVNTAAFAGETAPGAGESAPLAEHVLSVQEQLDALPQPEDLSAMDIDAVSVAHADTQAAYSAYLALTGEEQAQVVGAEKFEALLNTFAAYVAPAAQYETISCTYGVYTMTFEASTNAAYSDWISDCRIDSITRTDSEMVVTLAYRKYTGGSSDGVSATAEIGFAKDTDCTQAYSAPWAVGSSILSTWFRNDFVLTRAAKSHVNNEGDDCLCDTCGYNGMHKDSDGNKVCDRDGCGGAIPYHITTYSAANGDYTVSTSVPLIAGHYEHAGNTVTVTATPKEGYLLTDLVVQIANSTEMVAVSGMGNVRTFVMPASDVVIEPKFGQHQQVYLAVKDNATPKSIEYDGKPHTAAEFLLGVVGYEDADGNWINYLTREQMDKLTFSLTTASDTSTQLSSATNVGDYRVSVYAATGTVADLGDGYYISGNSLSFSSGTYATITPKPVYLKAEGLELEYTGKQYTVQELALHSYYYMDTEDDSGTRIARLTADQIAQLDVNVFKNYDTNNNVTYAQDVGTYAIHLSAPDGGIDLGNYHLDGGFYVEIKITPKVLTGDNLSVTGIPVEYTVVSASSPAVYDIFAAGMVVKNTETDSVLRAEDYTVTCVPQAEGARAGKFTVTVSPSGKSNYTFAPIVLNDQELTAHITVPGTQQSVTYNGSARGWEAFVTSDFKDILNAYGVTVTIQDADGNVSDQATNAGQYTLVFTPADPYVKLSADTMAVEIKPAVGELVAEMDVTEIPYSTDISAEARKHLHLYAVYGSEKIEIDPDADGVHFYYMQSAPVDGVYTLTVHFEKNNLDYGNWYVPCYPNSAGEDQVQYTMHQTALNVVPAADLVYSGQAQPLLQNGSGHNAKAGRVLFTWVKTDDPSAVEQTYEMVLSQPSDFSIEAACDQVTGNAAGTYKVTVELQEKANDDWKTVESKEVTVTIEVPRYELVLENIEVIYDGNSYYLPALVDITLYRNGKVFTYDDSVEFKFASSEDETPESMDYIGDHVTTLPHIVYVYAYVNEELVAKGSIEYGIKPKEITLTMGEPKTILWDGKAHNFSDFFDYSLQGVVEGEQISIVFDTASLPHDMGSYTLPIKPSYFVYVLSNDSPKKVTVTIRGKAVIAITLSEKYSTDAYSAADQLGDYVEKVEILGVYNEVLHTLTSDEYDLSLHENQLRAFLRSDWTSDDGNYYLNRQSDYGAIDFIPRAYAISADGASGLVYDGNERQLLQSVPQLKLSQAGTSDAYDTISDASFVYTVNGTAWDGEGLPTAQDAGAYTVVITACRDGKSVFTKTVEVTIAQAQPTVEVVLKDSLIPYREGLAVADVLDHVKVNGITLPGDYYTAAFSNSSIAPDTTNKVCITLKQDYSVNANYETLTAGTTRDSAEFDIKAYTIEVTRLFPTYNGRYQSLFGKPVLKLGDRVVEGATFEYSLDGGERTAEMPTVRDVKDGSSNLGTDYHIDVYASLDGKQVGQWTLINDIFPATATEVTVESAYDAYYEQAHYDDSDALKVRKESTCYAIFGGERIKMDDMFVKQLVCCTPEVSEDKTQLTFKYLCSSGYTQGNIIVPQGTTVSLTLPIQYCLMDATAKSDLVYTGSAHELLSGVTISKGIYMPEPIYSYQITDANGQVIGSREVGNTSDLIQSVCAENAGDYTVVLTAKNPDDGKTVSKTVTASIAKAEANVMVYGSASSYKGAGYTAGELLDSVTLNGEKLTEGTHYTAQFAADETRLTDGKAVDAGEYKVVVALTDAAAAQYPNYDCTGSTQATVTISPMKTNFTQVFDKYLPPLEYNGNAYTAESFRSGLPGLMGYWKINNEFELLNADYITEEYVSLKLLSKDDKGIDSAENAGKYVIRVDAAKDIVLGNYCIPKDTRYVFDAEITPKAITPSVNFPAEVEYKDGLGSADFVTVSCSDGLAGSDSIADAYDVTFNGSAAIPAALGEYTVKVAPKADGNYTFTETSGTVMVYKTLRIENIAVVYDPAKAYASKDVIGWLRDQFEPQRVGYNRPNIYTPVLKGYNGEDYSIENAGTYEFTVELVEGYENGYRLANGGKFTLTIDPARGTLSAENSRAPFTRDDVNNPAKFIKEVKIGLESGTVVLQEGDYTVEWFGTAPDSLMPYTEYPVVIALKEGSQAAANMFAEPLENYSIVTGKRQARVNARDFATSVPYDGEEKDVLSIVTSVNVNTGTDEQPEYIDKTIFGAYYFTAEFKETEAKVPGTYTIVMSPTKELKSWFWDYEILPGEVTFTIDQAEVVITPPAEKVYGEPDPTGYTMNAGSDALNAEAQTAIGGLSVSFTRETGEDAGTYAYTGMTIGDKSCTANDGDCISIGYFRFILDKDAGFTIARKPVDRIRGTLLRPTYHGEAHAATDFIHTVKDHGWYLMDEGHSESSRILKVDPLTDLIFSFKDGVVPVDAGEYTLVIALGEELAKNYSLKNGTQEVPVYVNPAEGTLEVTPNSVTYSGSEYGPYAFIDKVELVTTEGARIELTNSANTAEYIAVFGNSSRIVNVNHNETITVYAIGNSNFADAKISFKPEIKPLPVTLYLLEDVVAEYGDMYWTKARFGWKTDGMIRSEVEDLLNNILKESPAAYVTGAGQSSYPDASAAGYEFLSARINDQVLEDGVETSVENFLYSFDPDGRMLYVEKKPAVLSLALADDLELTYTNKKNYTLDDLGIVLTVVDEDGNTLKTLTLEECNALGIDCYMAHNEYNTVQYETGDAGDYKVCAVVKAEALPNYDFGEMDMPYAAFTLNKQRVTDINHNFQWLTYDGEAHGIEDFWIDNPVNGAYITGEIDGKVEATYEDFEFTPDDEQITSITNAGECLHINIRLSGELAKNYAYGGSTEVSINKVRLDIKVTTRDIVYDGEKHELAEFIDKVELTDINGNAFKTLTADEYRLQIGSDPAPDLISARPFKVYVILNTANDGTVAGLSQRNYLFQETDVLADAGIQPAKAALEIVLKDQMPVYNGEAHRGDDFVEHVQMTLGEDEIELTEAVDYELVFTDGNESQVDAGAYEIRVRLLPESKYYGNVVFEKDTAQVSIEKANAVIDTESMKTVYVYSGKLQTAEGAQLNHSECELTYTNNTFTTVEEGNGKVVAITAKETRNYLAAEASVTLTVKQANMGSDTVTVSPIADQTYTGKEIKPEVEVKIGDKVLKNNVDYALIYRNNVEVGEATVLIIGKGNLTGERAVVFLIKAVPTPTPTVKPTATPTAQPTATPTAKPEATPTAKPEATPTAKPEATPTAKPDTTPTAKPEATPTAQPEATPTAKPEATPTAKPEATPTAKPEVTPTAKPEATPTAQPEATATAQPDIVPQVTSVPAYERLALLLGSKDTGTPPTIVFDRNYAPQTYELLSIMTESNAQEKILLVCAQPDEDGKAAQRSLILTREQLEHLASRQGVAYILFENGSGMVIAKVEDMLAAAGQVENAPDKYDVEICIAPAEDGSGYEYHVYLRVNEESEEITDLIENLYVCMLADDLADAHGDKVTDSYTLIRKTEGAEETVNDVQQLLIPDEMPGDDTAERYSVTVSGANSDRFMTMYSMAAKLNAYRHHVLAAPHAGEGVYAIKAK